MKKQKAFDCLEMKREIQRKLEEEFAGVSEDEMRRILRERIDRNPILGPFLKKVKVHGGEVQTKK